MSRPDLTTIEKTAEWLGLSTPDDYPLLKRLISQASRMIYGYLQRPSFFQHTYTDRYDGSGSKRQMLRHWPVLSVSSVVVGVQTIPAAASYGQAGWTLEPWNGMPPGGPQSLNLSGYTFCQGLGNVAVTYTAGYAVEDEEQTVPGSSPYQVIVDAPHGSWAADQGVTYANGTALTKVTANPAQGQYTLGAGIYTFNAADAGEEVIISYSYVPFDIEQACIELVAERYRYKDRIGESSKSLGGQETVSYSLKDMPDYVRDLLQPYRQTVPV